MPSNRPSVSSGEKGAAELSDLTHEFSRSWNSASEGQELNIYVDLIPDDEFAGGPASEHAQDGALGRVERCPMTAPFRTFNRVAARSRANELQDELVHQRTWPR